MTPCQSFYSIKMSGLYLSSYTYQHNIFYTEFFNKRITDKSILCTVTAQC